MLAPCPTFALNLDPAYHPLAALPICAQVSSHSTLEPFSSVPSSVPSPLTELHVSQRLQGPCWVVCHLPGLPLLLDHHPDHSLFVQLPHSCPRSPHSRAGCGCRLFPCVQVTAGLYPFPGELRARGRLLNCAQQPLSADACPHLQCPDHRMIQPPPLTARVLRLLDGVRVALRWRRAHMPSIQPRQPVWALHLASFCPPQLL